MRLGTLRHDSYALLVHVSGGGREGKALLSESVMHMSVQVAVTMPFRRIGPYTRPHVFHDFRL
jgi:hypothetical protein